MKVSKLHKLALEYIAKKIVVQGPNHKDNLIEYYKIIQDAAKNEFTEDNITTLENFLKEAHEEAIKQLSEEGNSAC